MRLRHRAAALIETLLALLLPDRCAGCGQLGTLLCQGCRAALQPYDGGAPRAVAHLAGVRIAYVFEGPLRHALHQLKYQRRRRVARPLGALLAQHLCARPLPADAVASIPLHPTRLAERGFNQAEEIAAQVAAGCGLTLVSASLARVRATEQQALLDSAARAENVRGAFAWCGAAPPPARIVLVDDVLTTGATMDACAAALRAAGAREVYGAALARSRLKP